MEINEILSRCDHTLLAVTSTSEEIRALCDEAIEYGCASVCIPACHVRGARAYVGEQMKVCTVVGFPNGYCTTEAKAFETADAVKNGADTVKTAVCRNITELETFAGTIKNCGNSCGCAGPSPSGSPL